MTELFRASKAKRATWAKVCAGFLAFSINLTFGGVAVFLPATVVYAANPVTLFSDGFESDDFSNWDFVDSPKWDTVGNPANSHSGDVRAEVKGSTGHEDDVLRKAQPTLGYENITLSYSYKVKEALENGDHVYVEWSSDGNLWITMEDLTNLPASEDWVTSSHLIGSPDQVEFRFRANLNAGEDRLFLDDVLLTGEVLEGRISGYKFYDADGSGGARDIFNDPGIAGWRIVLLDENGDEQDSTITAGVNGNDGDYIYIFNELADGVYTICESAYDNWTQTYPTGEVAGATACAEGEGYAPWGWEATIENGEIASGPESFDFSNAPELGVISVLKFNDRNGNGVRDEGEEGIGGIEFRLNTHGDSLALADDFLAQLFSFLIPEDFNRYAITNEDGVAEWDRLLPAGSYTIEEQEAWENGWIPTTDTEQGVELRGEASEEVRFGNRRPTLVVYKYDYDSEELLPGWEICLYEAEVNEGDDEDFDGKEGNFSLGELIECRETIDDSDEESGEEGKFHGAAVFSVENLEPDRWYVVDEEERGGWQLDSWDWENLDEVEELNRDLGQVLIQLNESILDNSNDARLYLYNSPPQCDLEGYKYMPDGEEQRGVPNVVIGVMGIPDSFSERGDFELNDNDRDFIRTTKTDGDGHYCFPDLPGGQHRVFEMPPVETEMLQMTLQGEPQNVIPFLGEGESEGGEVIDQPIDLLVDSFFDVFYEIDGGPMQMVDSFFDIFAEVALDVPMPPNPTLGSFFDVFIEVSFTGNEDHDGQIVDFYNQPTGTGEGEPGSFITGYKWNDLNGNGVWEFQDLNGNGIWDWDTDEGEPALEGWTIGLGHAGEPQQEEGEGQQQIPIEIIALSLTGSDGSFRFETHETGNFVLLEEQRNGWMVKNPSESPEWAVDSFFDITYRSDFDNPPAQWETNSFFDVYVGGELGQEISYDVNDNSLDFGNLQKGQDAVITGKKFEDMNADGIGEEDQGLSGRVIVAILQDDPNTEEVESGNHEELTDDGGNYTLQVPPGTYKICEAILGTWHQSYPTVSTAGSTSCDSDGVNYFEFGYELIVASANNINGKDFGNYRNGTIHGFKWEDLNGNGVFDEDDENSEEGLDGWTIYLDLNDNGILDDGEPSFVSGEDDDGGVYVFQGNNELAPGTYIVREVPQSGWTQTFPGADTNFKHTVVITSRGEETDWNFGNHRLLVISEDTATQVLETSIVIMWTTDFPGTSRVVYDTVSHPVLGSAPNYGYANSTATFDEEPEVTSHSVSVGGLTAGTTYYYRTISSASPQSLFPY